MSELRGIVSGAILMLAGIGAGFMLNEVARKGWPQAPRRTQRVEVGPKGPIVATIPLTEDDKPLSFRPPPAAPDFKTVDEEYERDMKASEGFYAMQEMLRLQAMHGDNVGMMMS